MSKDSRFIYTVTQTSPAYEDNVGASVTVLVTDKPHIGKDGNISESQNEHCVARNCVHLQAAFVRRHEYLLLHP